MYFKIANQGDPGEAAEYSDANTMRPKLPSPPKPLSTEILRRIRREVEEHSCEPSRETREGRGLRS